MRKNQLIDILKTLNKSENREFRKWLCSPVHNQREDVVLLFDYLMAGDHLNQDKFLEKERIYRKIFGKQAYNDARLRQTNYFLTRCLEQYLAYKEWKEDKVGSKSPVIEQLRKRNLSKVIFTRILNNLHQAQEAQPYRTEKYFRNEYLIQLDLFYYTEERERSPRNNLQDVSIALDKSYLIEKLMLSCQMLFRQSVYKTDFDFGPLHELISYIEGKDLLLDEPAIAVYYYILKALIEENDYEYFEKVRKEVKSNGNIFPNSQRLTIYLMAINFCIGKMNMGSKQFAREALEWYKLGLSEHILIDNGRVSKFTYKNTVATALIANELDWCNEFIENYQSYLDPNDKSTFYSLCKSMLCVAKGDYPAAMKLLVQFDSDDLLLILNSKKMLLKIYYELDEFDALESLLESMRTYVKRKEILGYHRNTYQNLIRLTKKLVRVDPFSKEKIQKLRSLIESTNPITEKQWLLTQLDKI